MEPDFSSLLSPLSLPYGSSKFGNEVAELFPWMKDLLIRPSPSLLAPQILTSTLSHLVLRITHIIGCFVCARRNTEKGSAPLDYFMIKPII